MFQKFSGLHSKSDNTRSWKDYVGAEISKDDVIKLQIIGTVGNTTEEKGAQSRVYKGTCWGFPVAIKEVRLSPNPQARKVSVEQFKGEIKLLSRISHPNVCQFLGACFEDDKWLMVNELMKRDLADLLEDNHAHLNLFKKLKIAHQIAQGMAWLHNLGIVHDDLKPENILLDANEAPKITDFGYSHLIESNRLALGSDTLVQRGGSALYMSPQRLQGSKGDFSSDVYSYALILWQLLTRKVPFSSYFKLPPRQQFTKFQYAVCHLNERPEIPEEYASYSTLVKLIRDCWHKEREMRPSFERISTIFTDLLIDAAIVEPNGRNLWRSHFVKTQEEITDNNNCEKRKVSTLVSEVPWSDFVVPFLESLSLDPALAKAEIPANPSITELPPNPTAEQLMDADISALEEFQKASLEAEDMALNEIQRRENIVKLDCAKQFLVVDGNVSLERFGKITAMFGPLNKTLMRYDFLEKILLVMSKPWFHGEIDSEEAYTRLKDKDIGTFLVRFSSRQNNFVISKVIEKDGKKWVNHVTVRHLPDGFTFQNNQIYPDIVSLIENSSSVLKYPQRIEAPNGMWLKRVALRGFYETSEVYIPLAS